MKAVIGQAELRTKDDREVEGFIREHLRDLADHTISIALRDGQYLAEFYSTAEPAT